MMSDFTHNLVGQVFEGRYRFDAFVGRGGMADVYKVWDQQRAVFLAAKVLNADMAEDIVFLQRFEREAHTLDRLQHPNIVRFYGLVSSGDLAYILMDYIEGMSLRKEISLRRQGMSSQRILAVMRPVCAALHYAHQQGRVHCDIKPANIMIHTNGTIYVTDFGISHMSESRTSTLAGAGTPAYMAPEQFQQSTPSPAVDIYALGVTLFEMLTGGQRPFTGDEALETGTVSQKIIWEKTHLQPPSPRKYNPLVSPQFEALVMRCLQRDPQARYSSTLALYQALQEVVEGETPEPDDPTLFEPPLPAEIPPAVSNDDARDSVPSETGRTGPKDRRNASPAAPARSRPAAALGLVSLVLVPLILLWVFFQSGGLGAVFPTPTATSPAPTQGAEVQAVSTSEPLPGPGAAPSPEPTITALPSITPTGGGAGWIAFASNRSGSVQVWVMNWQGGKRRQVTEMTNGACDPAWSPDGSRLAFISPCQGPRPSYPGSKIYLTTLDGKDIETLDLPLGGFDPAWSPDGRKISFSYVYENKISVALYDLENHEITELTGHGTLSNQAAWSGEGESLAFISDDRQPGEIWLIGADGKSLELFHQGGWSEAFSYPAWSPDGRWMVATIKVNSSPNTTLARLENQPGGKVVVSSFLAEPFASTHATFSPDGQWVAFEGWPGATNREIYVASADGKTVNRITNHEAQDFHPAWGK